MNLPESLGQVDPDVLELDAQTCNDLEIFSSAEGTSLFEVFNHSCTEGGARALRRRMQHPSSSPARIRATQQSIAFILSNRALFDPISSLGYVTTRVERHLNDLVQPLSNTNTLEFTLLAAELWLNRNRDYARLAWGVQTACRFVRQLRQFVEQPALEAATGELSAIYTELEALLTRTGLRGIPDGDVEGFGSWRILRIDQLLRFHEAAAMTRLLQLAYELDALVAMADTTGKLGLTIPSIENGPLRVEADGLAHIFVSNPVTNPVQLDQGRRLLFLTGPNMAGKTTYLRALATAIYLAHLGVGVPARSFRFVPAQRLFTAISLTDDQKNGVSYFRAEALRVKSIVAAIAAGMRVVALLDEPFKGTNVKDALDASLAILERLAIRNDCLFVFSSHLIELREQLEAIDQVCCCHFEADERDGKLDFDYLLRPGVSSQRLGMRVLREEGIFDVLDAGAEID